VRSGREVEGREESLEEGMRDFGMGIVFFVVFWGGFGWAEG
jgi:hypothetical protein